MLFRFQLVLNGKMSACKLVILAKKWQQILPIFPKLIVCDHFHQFYIFVARLQLTNTMVLKMAKSQGSNIDLTMSQSRQLAIVGKFIKITSFWGGRK